MEEKKNWSLHPTLTLLFTFLLHGQLSDARLHQVGWLDALPIAWINKKEMGPMRGQRRGDDMIIGQIGAD